MSDFAVFIISHGRPNNIKTISALKNRGFTGKTYIVIDNTDKQIDEYKKIYGDQVIVFDKNEIAKTTDQGDNFNNLRTTTHARNACFDIAENLGLKYFLVLDDDYNKFEFRFDRSYEYSPNVLLDINIAFSAMISFLENTKIKSIAFAQGGDFIGGSESQYTKKIKLSRKCMNSFFCKTENRIKFISRLNEDVNTYITGGARGDIFFTTNQVSLSQIQTQTSSGGMTEAYLDFGTYVKSFYSVMYQPSSVIVRPMAGRGRLHHLVNWKNTVPLILSESARKNA